MKNTVKIIFVSLLYIFCLQNPAPAKQQTTLKFATIHPTTSLMFNSINPWIEKIEKASNGSLKIKMYPGGTLGRNSAQYLQKLEKGVCDITSLASAELPGVFPDDLLSRDLEAAQS